MILNAFFGGSYEASARTQDVSKTVNWFLEKTENPGSTAELALLPTPGVTEIAVGVGGAGRGHFFMDSREFAVIGTNFYEIDNAGTLTVRGTVALNANPATISSNGDGGDQLFVTSGGNGYYYNLTTNTLTQIAALNGKATMGDHLDGYFLVIDSSTSTLYISDLLDGATWNTGLDFAQRSSAPDPWIAMIVAQSYVWLLGQLTSEIWYNSGAAFPFAKYTSGLVKYGCAAAFSADIVDQGLTWLSTADKGGYQVVRASGLNVEIISSLPLDRQIGDHTTVSDAQADVYAEDGHTFYILTFPTANVTHAWDLKTRQWHDRGTWQPADNVYAAWRPRWHAFAFGEHRMLDADTGSVYRMASDLGLDVGAMPIRRLRRAAAVSKENKRVKFPGFELVLDTGLGLTSGQGSDPQVMFRYSRDGGKNWSAEQMRSAGKTGEFSRRVRWSQLGTSRQMVVEVSVSDPIPWKLTQAVFRDPVVLGQTRGAA